MDFDKENEADSATALDNIRAIQCPFNKEDIEFWFSQLEDQLTLIGVKKQWTKKIALVRFLPAEVQSEVKSLLTLKQSTAGTDIYFKIKKNSCSKSTDPKQKMRILGLKIVSCQVSPHSWVKLWWTISVQVN